MVFKQQCERDVRLVTFIWKLRAPSVESSLIRYCPDAPESWKHPTEVVVDSHGL